VTNALIEKVARLLHDTFREAYHARHPDQDEPPTFDEKTEEQRDYLRAAARAAIKALGR